MMIEQEIKCLTFLKEKMTLQKKLCQNNVQNVLLNINATYYLGEFIIWKS